MVVNTILHRNDLGRISGHQFDLFLAIVKRHGVDPIRGSIKKADSSATKVGLRKCCRRVVLGTHDYRHPSAPCRPTELPRTDDPRSVDVQHVGTNPPKQLPGRQELSHLTKNAQARSTELLDTNPCEFGLRDQLLRTPAERVIGVWHHEDLLEAFAIEPRENPTEHHLDSTELGRVMPKRKPYHCTSPNNTIPQPYDLLDLCTELGAIAPVSVHKSNYPTLPSIWSSMRRLHSTAYSIGRVRVTGSMKPLTIIPIACSSVRPRLWR